MFLKLIKKFLEVEVVPTFIFSIVCNKMEKIMIEYRSEIQKYFLTLILFSKLCVNPKPDLRNLQSIFVENSIS